MAELKLSVLHKPGRDNYKLLTSQNEAPKKHKDIKREKMLISEKK